jgi:hypothetical protein
MTFMAAIPPRIKTRRHALAAVLLGALLAMPVQRRRRSAFRSRRSSRCWRSPPSAARARRAHRSRRRLHARRFDATAPIEIDVATLHALPQPGCARLEVTTRQRDVLEQGKRADQELRWQVSFCRDGSFPEKR